MFRIQKRLFKCILIGDIESSLIIQRLILNSNFSRLLAIYEVTKLSSYKNIPGIDGNVLLTFTERFELNEFLKLNYNNWYFQNIRVIPFVKKFKKIYFLNLPTISDRAWQSLIFFCISPAHEASFNFRNFGYRESFSVHLVQKIICLNLSKYSFGYQKRILIFNIDDIFDSFDFNFFIFNVFSPRGIKLGILRSFKSGFSPSYHVDDLNISFLFANIILNGIQKIHSCVHFGYNFLFFLKPFHDENSIFQCFYSFLISLGFKKVLFSSINLFKVSDGFDFLGWHFLLSKNNDSFSTPSFSNYQDFLIKVKRIINNSNFGSRVKLNKVYPLIKDWFSYHRNSIMISKCFSLFFLNKEVFNIFNKESTQDFYSVKKFLDKCFNFYFYKKNMNFYFLEYLLYYKHITFWFNGCSCICCGMTINDLFINF